MFVLLTFPGGYAPDCDVQGFYKPTQCHSSVGVCWCVDKHGVEFANTRTRGKPNCGTYSFNDSQNNSNNIVTTKNHPFISTDEVITNALTNVTSDDEDDESENDDDDSTEGSADNLLSF